jgi:hypothetical protein
MQTQQTARNGEFVFRHYKPLALAGAAVYVGVALGMVAAAVALGVPGVALLAALPAWLTALALLRYNTESVTVRGDLLVLRYGTLAVHEFTAPLWACAPNFDQGLWGRVLNYGTLTVNVDGRRLHMGQLAHFRTLRALVASRQASLVSPGRRLLPL